MLLVSRHLTNIVASNILENFFFSDPDSELAIESRDTEEFITEETLGTISEIVAGSSELVSTL
jgi:uncharacterized Fe-S cluster-containing MiaB family protein